MPPQAPSFGSQNYWNNRFTANSNPFEWLEAPNALDPFLVHALQCYTDECPEILHIGCGTSLLSYHLRAHVQNPEQIHNLDYSDVAVQVGRKREVDLFSKKGDSNGNNGSMSISNDTAKDTKSSTGKPGIDDPTVATTSHSAKGNPEQSMKCMHWSSADLLSHSSLLRICKPSGYSIIVDKSTSDSIACADDLYVPLPYPIYTSMNNPGPQETTESFEPIHPLHILAIHMALLTKPKGKWISLSYSEDRYPFLRVPPATPDGFTHASASVLSANEHNGNISPEDDLDDIPEKIIKSGLPDPGTLWRLESKHEIEVPDTTPQIGAVYRPRVVHWVYVLERTGAEVFVRDD